MVPIPPRTAVQREQFVNNLFTSAQSTGLHGIVSEIHRYLTFDVGLFEPNGNVLALSPERTIWNFDSVIQEHSNAEHQAFSIRTLTQDEETVALLVIAHSSVPEFEMSLSGNVISMEIARLRARLEGRRELAASVIDDVLNSRTSDAESLSRLNSLDIDISRPYRLLVGTAQQIVTGRNLIPLGLTAATSNHPEPFLRIVREGNVVMLVPEGPIVLRIAETLHAHLSDIGTAASVGVSSSFTGVSGLRGAYYEALTGSKQGPGISTPTLINLSKLLMLTGSALPLNEMSRNILGPLFDYDKQHRGNLFETLSVHLKHNRQIAQTAQSLFVHRNTLRYRLRLIEDLLSISLEDTEAIVNISLAIHCLNEHKLDIYDGGEL